MADEAGWRWVLFTPVVVATAELLLDGFIVGIREGGLDSDLKGVLLVSCRKDCCEPRAEARWFLMSVRSVGSVRNSSSANLKEILEERHIDERPLKCRRTMVPRMLECKVDGAREKSERQLFTKARTTALYS